MESHFFDHLIRVLIYTEDSEIVAHALELDLLGYGKNEDEATQELLELVKTQLSFCSSVVGNSKMAVFPAPKEYFERWEKAHMASAPVGDKAFVLLADKSWKKLSPGRFSQVDPVCA